MNSDELIQDFFGNLIDGIKNLKIITYEKSKYNLHELSKLNEDDIFLFINDTYKKKFELCMRKRVPLDLISHNFGFDKQDILEYILVKILKYTCNHPDETKKTYEYYHIYMKDNVSVEELEQVSYNVFMENIDKMEQ